MAGMGEGHSARATRLAVGVAVCCLAIPVALDAWGRSTRTPAARRGGGTEVLVAPTDAKVLEAWASRGLRGRTLVHAGRFLHYIDAEVWQATARELRGPGTGRALDARLVASADSKNYIAVAASTGIARRIFYFSPPHALDGRLATLGKTRAALPLRIDAGPMPRVLDEGPPALDEPVLLDVDASWFDDGDATTLLSAIAAAGLRIELATLSLAEDADDVSPGARESLRAFASTFAARDARSRP